MADRRELNQKYPQALSHCGYVGVCLCVCMCVNRKGTNRCQDKGNRLVIHRLYAYMMLSNKTVLSCEGTGGK